MSQLHCPYPGQSSGILRENTGLSIRIGQNMITQETMPLLTLRFYLNVKVEKMARKFWIEFMEQEKLGFKLSVILHTLQCVIWALCRSLLNRDTKPLVTSIQLIHNLTRSFFRYHTLRLSRCHMTKGKIGKVF